MANNWESSGSKLTSGRTINTEGAWELYRYGLLAPPDCRIPKEWRLSDGGLVVPPIPRTAEQVRRYIARRRSWMTPAERRLPENDDGQHNWGSWLDRFEQERQAVIDLVDSPDVLLSRWNAIGRRRWWDGTGHTVASAIEAARRHAATGNVLPLRLLPLPARGPIAQRRRGAPGIVIRDEPRRRTPPRRHSPTRGRHSPPRGRLFLRQRRPEPQPRATVKEEPQVDDLYHLPSPLRDPLDGDCPGLLAAMANSVATLEQEAPGWLTTLHSTAVEASGSRGGCSSVATATSSTHTTRAGPSSSHGGPSSSHAASSSKVVLLDDSDDDWSLDSFDWSGDEE